MATSGPVHSAEHRGARASLWHLTPASSGGPSSPKEGRTKEQTENYSLATQERACREYCRRQCYAVAAVFVEEGESAKTADRTEFQKLLKYCRANKGRVRYVVVHSLSRFSRQMEDQVLVTMELRALGVSLLSVTEPIGDSALGKFLANFLGAQNQLDNDLKADRTRLGMKAALSAGKWPFLTPLGYRRRDDGDGRSVIEPDPERAPLVRRALESYATGLRKQRELLRELTALGLRTTGGAAVSLQTFENVLRNPFYCGALSVRGWDDIEPQRGDFEALISEELFEQVQRVLDGKTPRAVPHDGSNPDFPLRSFVRCACCGAALTGSWSRGRAKRYPYYRCPKSCDGGNVRKEVLEDAFLKHLDSQSPKPELLKLFRRIVLDVWRQKNADVVTTQQQIRRKLDQLTAKKDNVVEAFLHRGVITRDVYERQIDLIDAEITTAK